MKKFLPVLGVLVMANANAHAQAVCKEKVDSVLSSSVSYAGKLDQLVALKAQCGGDDYYDLVTARLYATNRNYSAALKLLTERAETGPYAENFALLEAKIYSVTGEYQKALDVLDQYLAVGQKSASVYLFRGKILNSMRKFEEALNSFRASAEIQPIAEAYQAAAVSLFALGRCEQAVESIDQAAVLDEKTFHDLGSMLVMSHCSAMQGKFVVATNALKMLLQNNPAVEQHADFQKAVKDLREKIKIAKASGDKSTDAHLVELTNLK